MSDRVMSHIEKPWPKTGDGCLPTVAAVLIGAAVAALIATPRRGDWATRIIYRKAHA